MSVGRVIRVDSLARVEGEGGLTIVLGADDEVREVRLAIFEPPRFFEALLRGRDLSEAPDITARVCGICPVAYLTSASQALEDALGLHVSGPLRDLRRLLYCGEWIESHALSVFFLQAPDFLGLPDLLAMAKDHREWVGRALCIKKAGNDLVALVGGREIHPINVRVGGFYRVPERAELQSLLPRLQEAHVAAIECLEWMAGFEFPSLARDYELVCLRHPDEYPICEGRLASSRGLDIDVREYEAYFVEEQVPHSTALHSRLRARGAYLCGPLARFGLCFEQLDSDVRKLARDAGLDAGCRNPFRAPLIRLVEVVQVLGEAQRLIAGFRAPEAAHVPWVPRASRGAAGSEAPRGFLYHRYDLAADGTIRDARLVPPTSQNQLSIEDDLRAIAPRLARIPMAQATRLAEQTVRNYDPCISCATHFLKLRIEREST